MGVLKMFRNSCKGVVLGTVLGSVQVSVLHLENVRLVKCF